MIRATSHRTGSRGRSGAGTSRSCSRLRGGKGRRRGCRTASHRSGSRPDLDEDELCICIDEATDQPRARCTVDVAVRGASPTSCDDLVQRACQARDAASARSRSGAGSDRALRIRWSSRRRRASVRRRAPESAAHRLRGVIDHLGVLVAIAPAIRAASARSWLARRLADPDGRLAAGSTRSPRSTRVLREYGCPAGARRDRRSAAQLRAASAPPDADARRRGDSGNPVR